MCNSDVLEGLVQSFDVRARGRNMDSRQCCCDDEPETRRETDIAHRLTIEPYSSQLGNPL